MSQAGGARQEGPLKQRLCQQGMSPPLLWEGASLSPEHILLIREPGQREDLWDKAGSLARDMCTPGRRFLCESPEDFSCLQPVGPDSPGSKEELSSSSPIISLACWCDFPGPFFLSVSTVTWPGRKFARVSDNCVKGSRKQGRKEAGQHRPAPPAGPSSLRYQRIQKVLGCVWAWRPWLATGGFPH